MLHVQCIKIIYPYIVTGQVVDLQWLYLSFVLVNNNNNGTVSWSFQKLLTATVCNAIFTMANVLRQDE